MTKLRTSHRNPIGEDFFKQLEELETESHEMSNIELMLDEGIERSKERELDALDVQERIARFESCRAMAVHIVNGVFDKTHGGKLFGREDLEQVALIALAKAAAGFDPTRGWKFATVAYRYMQNAVTSALRKEYHRREHETGYLDCRADNRATTSELVDTLTYGDESSFGGDPSSHSDIEDLRELFDGCIEELTEVQQKLIRAFMEGHSVYELCRLNIAENPMDEFRSALATLKQAVAKQGLEEGTQCL